jgi:hypothetical protein
MQKGSRLIIVALKVGAVKIYGATLEALKKKERQGETQFTTKTEVHAPLNANGFFKYNLTLFMIKLKALV